jgi:hypothetical protein
MAPLPVLALDDDLVSECVGYPWASIISKTKLLLIPAHGVLYQRWLIQLHGRLIWSICEGLLRGCSTFDAALI